MSTLAQLAASPPSAANKNRDAELDALRARVHKMLHKAGVVVATLECAAAAEVRARVRAMKPCCLLRFRVDSWLQWQRQGLMRWTGR